MASTSVHIPDDLLVKIDTVAADQGTSRNRIVVESCRRFVETSRRWPAGFFTNDHLSEHELAELRSSTAAWEESVAERRSGERSPW